LARNRAYAKEVGFYEISNVFVKLPDKGAQPDEPLRLGVTVRRQSDAYSAAKGILDALARELNLELRMEPDALPAYAPGRCAQVQFGGKSVGVIGQIHPELLRGLKLDGEAAHVELDLAPLLEASTAPRAVPAQRFPAIRRDLAVLVPTDVNWQMVHDVLAGLDAAFVSDYAGGELPTGYKGMTVRLTLSHPERTPTEAEAVDLEKRSLKLLERKLGAKPRD
jgi:phenylalanyl-tRNA synthetase beta chain